MKKYLSVFSVITLIACSKESKTHSDISGKDPTVKNPADSISAHEIEPVHTNASREEILKTINNELLSALKSKKYEKLTKYIHPEKGVRFSMYAYSDPKKDRHFTKEEFEQYVPTDIRFTWGQKDGTGDLLVLSIKEYLETWVFVKDFSKSQYYLNAFKGGGNSLNNLQEVYPSLNFTENYLPGTEQYSQMDWNSLRFVFEELYGTYYLVAVINDQWTV